MLSPSALGITPSQLYVRSRSPRQAFEALDPARTGVVSLEDARAALKSLGVHLNLTESKSLALAQVGGDRGVAHGALTLNYDQFLAAAGATQGRGDAPAAPPQGPFGGVSVPSSTRDVAAQLATRLLQERGIGGEGYQAMLAEAPQAAKRAYPGKRMVRGRRGQGAAPAPLRAPGSTPAATWRPLAPPRPSATSARAGAAPPSPSSPAPSPAPPPPLRFLSPLPLSPARPSSRSPSWTLAAA